MIPLFWVSVAIRVLAWLAASAALASYWDNKDRLQSNSTLKFITTSAIKQYIKMYNHNNTCNNNTCKIHMFEYMIRGELSTVKVTYSG